MNELSIPKNCEKGKLTKTRHQFRAIHSLFTRFSYEMWVNKVNFLQNVENVENKNQLVISWGDDFLSLLFVKKGIKNSNL